jgi:hypothetical protein
MEWLAKWYLTRKGKHLVLKNEIPMLVVSGFAVAVTKDNGITWEVSFPIRSHVVALNYSHVTIGGSHVTIEGQGLVIPMTSL